MPAFTGGGGYDHRTEGEKSILSRVIHVKIIGNSSKKPMAKGGVLGQHLLGNTGSSFFVFISEQNTV